VFSFYVMGMTSTTTEEFMIAPLLQRVFPFSPFSRFALIAACVSLPSVAAAQDTRATYTEQRTDSGAAIVFKEDLTTGSTLGSLGTTIIRPSAAFRMGLVRPRLNFVTELQKSVESL
jgi:hypothetical protein